MTKPIKITVWITTTLILIVAGLVGVSLYAQEIGFGAPAHPDFSGYRPTVLPAGIMVTGQTLTRHHQAGLDVWNFVYQVEFSNPEFTMSETKIGPYNSAEVSCRQIGDICNTYTAPNGQVYRILYPLSRGRPFSIQIDWHCGCATNCQLYIRGEDSGKFIKFNWGSTVRSMQKVDLGGMPYTKQTYSGWGG